MLNFVHNIPTIIYFGKGQVAALAPELSKRAKKVLIVTGGGSIKKHGIYDIVIDQVTAADVEYVELSGIKPNPRLKSVHKGIEICRKESVDFILAVGGGSVIDTAKAIAMGVKYEGDVWDFFIKLVNPQEVLPVGTVLTLAATGSEMNTNTVISNEATGRKLAFSSRLLRPVFSILDPVYTFTVNKYHTAAGVVDIMVHIFEQYFSHTPATDVQDRMAEALLKVCIKYGPVACDIPDDYDGRANILWASSLALNNLTGEGKTQDWASHAIEHELSAVYDISHGAGLAIITPNWMRCILSEKTVNKFAEYGINVWGIDPNKDSIEIANEAINKTQSFFSSLGLPTTLTQIDINDKKFKQMAQNAIGSWGRIGSFKELSQDDIVKILTISL